MNSESSDGDLEPDAAELGGLPDAPGQRAVVALVVLAALVPPYRMLGQVIGGSALQFGDYWLMIPRFTSPDGGLIAGGLFEFQSQPVVVPQLVYWLNIKLFSGSNTSLGMFVMALGLGQLVVIGLILRRSALSAVVQVALLLLASALIFDLNGAWSFAKSMSGTAWLSANLFALVAVYLRSCDRRLLSLVAAVLAAVSYGTGLAVWPALAAVGATRLPVRQWWREWPTVVGLVGTFLWYRSELPRREGEGASLGALVDRSTELLHLPFGLDAGSPVVGKVVIGVVVVLVPVLALTTQGSSTGSRSVAAWVGLATYALVAVFTIAYGRDLLIRTLGIHPRYTSLSSLTWLGAIGLVAFALPRARDRLADRRRDPWAAIVGSPWIPVAIAVPVIVMAMLAGGPHIRDLEEQKVSQDLREVAARIGVIDDTTYLIGGPFSDGPITITPLLSSIGHHPFVDGWQLDCGLLDEELPEGARGDGSEGRILRSVSVFFLRGTAEIHGQVDSDRDIDCVVVTGRDGKVVGAATVGVEVEGADEGATGFRALARPGQAPYQVWVIFEGDPVPVRVGDPVRMGDLVPE